MSAAAGGGAEPPPPSAFARIVRRAMACEFEILAVGDDPGRLRAAAEEALDEVERLEGQLSRFLPSSEISRLNARRARRVEPRLHALLVRCRELWEATGGSFDPAMGMRFVRFDRRGGIRFLRPGIGFDLGAIGKGYALDRAGAVLRERGVARAVLHGGSSTVLAIGEWTVGVLDPRSGARLGVVRLTDAALSASSGLGKAEAGRVPILDPRSKAEAEAVGAWSLAGSAADADALSTAFLVMGEEGTRRFVDAHAGVAGMVATGEGLSSFGFPLLEAPEVEAEPGPAGITRRAFVAAIPAALVATGIAAARGRRAAIARVALFGVGEQGDLLLSQLRAIPGVRVVAAADPHPPHLARAKGSGVALYANSSELLDEEEFDVGVVASPTHTHAAIAVPALEAGAAVFCEAPLAHSIEDARAIARAAKKSGRVLWVGHQRRTSKLYSFALEHVGSGAIGRVLQVRAQWNRKVSWRRAVEDPALHWRLARATSGGLLLEQGSHALDLVHWLTGTLPVRVGGFGALTHWTDGREVDDHLEAVFEYPGGLLVSFGAGLVSSHDEEFECVRGTGATILFRNQRKCLLFKEADAVGFGWEALAKKEMLGRARGIVLDVEATKYKGPVDAEELGPDAGRADFHAELSAFLAAARGEGPVLCGADAGLAACVAAVVGVDALANGRVNAFTRSHFEV